MVDEAFFERKFRELFEFSRGVARRILRNPGDVDDAVQEAWIRLHGALDRYDLSQGMEGLVARFVTNEALRIVGRAGRLPGTAGDVPLSALGEPLVPTSDDPEEALLRKDECHTAMRRFHAMALSRLQRKVLVGLIRGKTPQELSEELGISPAYLYVIKHRVTKMT